MLSSAHERAAASAARAQAQAHADENLRLRSIINAMSKAPATAPSPSPSFSEAETAGLLALGSERGAAAGGDPGRTRSTPTPTDPVPLADLGAAATPRHGLATCGDRRTTSPVFRSLRTFWRVFLLQQKTTMDGEEAQVVATSAALTAAAEASRYELELSERNMEAERANRL